MIEGTLPRITSQEPPLATDLPYNAQKAIDEIVGMLLDPIIVWPGYEGAVPSKLKEDITLHRLLQGMQGENGVASWPEVCAYLMTASLDHPFNREWVEIYEYAFAQYMGRDKALETLKYLKTELDTQQEYELRRFREWLWRTRRKRRLDQRRATARKEKLEVEAHAPQQIPFF